MSKQPPKAKVGGPSGRTSGPMKQGVIPVPPGPISAMRAYEMAPAALAKHWMKTGALKVEPIGSGYALTWKGKPWGGLGLSSTHMTAIEGAAVQIARAAKGVK